MPGITRLGATAGASENRGLQALPRPLGRRLALPRSSLLPAALLAGLLLALLLAVHQAYAASGGNETGKLAEEIRSVLEKITASGIPYSEAARVYEQASHVLPGPASGAAAAAAEALRGNAAPGTVAERLAGFLAALEQLGASGLRGCCPGPGAARVVYEAVRLAYYTPTGLGVLLPPAGSEAGLALGVPGGEWCSGPNGSAALAAALASGYVDDGMLEPLLLPGAGDWGPRCALAAVAQARWPGGLNVSPRLAGELLTAYYVSTGRAPPPDEAWVYEDAVAAAEAGDNETARGLLALLAAQHPGYVRALLDTGVIRPVNGDPLLGLLEPRLHWGRGQQPPGQGLYCRAAAALAGDILGWARNSSTASLELLGEAVSLCAARARSPDALAWGLRFNPFIPLDAAVLEAAGLRGPLMQVARLNSWGLRSQLRVKVGDEAALLDLVARAGLLNATARVEKKPGGVQGEEVVVIEIDLEKTVRELAPLLSLHPEWIAGNASRARSPAEALVRLGSLARLAGLRPCPGSVGGCFLEDYAAVRVVAWAALVEAQRLRGDLALGGLRDPLAPMQASFTVPGLQDLLRWSLGWDASLSPPSRYSCVGAPFACIQPGGPMEPANATREANSTAVAGPGAATGAEASRRDELLRELERLARTLDQLPGGAPYAQLVREAVDAIRSGDYARAAAAAQRLRSLLAQAVGTERAEELIRAAASSLGVSPAELARLLAEAASIGLSHGNTVTINPEEASILAKRLLEEAGQGGARGTGEGGSPQATGALATVVAEAVARSAAEAARSGRAVPVRIEGLDWLIAAARAGGSAFVGVAGLLRGLASATPNATGIGPVASWSPVAGGPAPRGAASPVPVATAPPAWAVAAAGLAAALAAAWRLGLLGRLADSLRARLAARRLQGGDASAAFAEVLRLVSRVYRERKPWETPREYGRGLLGALGDAYRRAALAYEALRFGGRREAARDLARALEELRRLVTRCAGRRGGGAEGC